MPEIEISAEQRKQIIDWIGTRRPARHIIGSTSDGRDSFTVEGESVIFYRKNDQEMVSIGYPTLEGLKADLGNLGFGEIYARAVSAGNRLIDERIKRNNIVL